MPPAAVGEHVLGDQIALTGHDLVVAAPADAVVDDALAEIRRTRELLVRSGLPELS